MLSDSINSSMAKIKASLIFSWAVNDFIFMDLKRTDSSTPKCMHTLSNRFTSNINKWLA